MPDLLQVSMPQVWADNLRSELMKRLENRHTSIELLTHGPGRPPAQNAAVIWLWYEEDFGAEKRPASGMKIYSRSRVMRLPKKMDPEAELWLQRLKQLEKDIQTQRNDLEFQKFCYRCVNFFRRNEQHWQQQLVLQSILKRVEPFEDLYIEGLRGALDKAISAATGVSLLEDVMRTLVNVLIIDNLGSKLPRKLGGLGYNSQRIKTMTLNQLQHLQKKIDPDAQQIDLRKVPTSLFQHPEMKKYDLVLINPWRFEGDKLPILILVRTTGNLSRKEEKSLAKQPQNLQRIEEAKQHLKDLQEQIDPIQIELDLIEADDFGNENQQEVEHYQHLLKSKKQLLEKIRQKESLIQELTKPIDPKRKTHLQLLNLMNCYSKEESIAEKATSMLKRAFTLENKRSQEGIQQDIKKLSLFLRQHVKIVDTLERIQSEMNKLESNLQNLITEKDSDATTPWRRPFLEYQLDNLEYCILKEQLTELAKS
jgi:tetratricopeptide (TPR) repeat protein